jgi:Protein of unknown function (DUF1761)
MEINYIAILIATVVQFIIGAVWYSFLFGKLWGEIHGFDALTKEVQQQMMKKMGPFYALQFFLTLVTTFMLAHYVLYWKDEASAFYVALMLLIGFVWPTQISAVIFGGTESKWLVKKIAVQAGASLAGLMGAAWVLQLL